MQLLQIFLHAIFVHFNLPLFSLQTSSLLAYDFQEDTRLVAIPFYHSLVYCIFLSLFLTGYKHQSLRQEVFSENRTVITLFLHF